jgi:hypothetical protein
MTFCRKVFWVLKNGQKKCPKSKSRNTFVQKVMHLIHSTFSVNRKYNYNIIIILNDENIIDNKFVTINFY